MLHGLDFYATNKLFGLDGKRRFWFDDVKKKKNSLRILKKCHLFRTASTTRILI